LVKHGQEGVEQYFSRHLGPPRAPEEMEIALRELASLAQDITHAVGPVRAYLLQRTDQHQCRVVYSAFFEGDADDAMVVPWSSKSQALCLQLREPILMRIRNIPAHDRVRPATKYIHAVRPAYVTHVYCVPIFPSATDWSIEDPMARPEPIAAFCVDFDSTADDVLLLDPDIEDWMVALAQASGEFWGDAVLTQLPALPDPPPPPSPDWTPIADARGYYTSARKIRGPLNAGNALALENAITRIQTKSRKTKQSPAA
jgi:NTE family protein